MKKVFAVALGIVTAIGGFLDAGTVATSGEAGAKYGFGLIWAVILATIEIILLVEMVGRFTAVSQKTYADAIREKFGFKFYLFPLASELIAESLLLAAELGGVAIALSLLTGPEALAGRISSRLRPIVHFLLRNRFEHSIPIDEIGGFHPTLRLRGRAIDYATGESERWLANHIFRWLPGSGWKEWHEQFEQSGTGTAEAETAAETRTEETRASGHATPDAAAASHQSQHHSH